MRSETENSLLFISFRSFSSVSATTPDHADRATPHCLALPFARGQIPQCGVGCGNSGARSPEGVLALVAFDYREPALSWPDGVP